MGRTAADQPSFRVRGPLLGQGAAAEGILRALPDWFGIESAIVDYAAAADRLPTFVATADGPCGDENVVGFVTLSPTSEDALELHVMGVLSQWHRRGVGGALVERAAAYARADGFTLLHVKTLAASDPTPGTRRRAPSTSRRASGRSRCFRRSGGPRTLACCS